MVGVGVGVAVAIGCGAGPEDEPPPHPAISADAASDEMTARRTRLSPFPLLFIATMTGILIRFGFA
ncbi:hypothetical protein BMF35_a1034 [Aurantiacibacter gangjinensis]|nr:hypothetical protein BMF35_a1034 [Aurantiacibacter gangjinensis]